MQQNVAQLRVGAMLEHVDRLPCAQAQRAAANRNRNLRRSERGPDVRGHVVAAFGGVAEPGRIFGDEALEKFGEVAPDVWVRVSCIVKEAEVWRMKTVSRPI